MIAAAEKSDTGCLRANNEDCTWVDPAKRFFIVADGMGGENCGEVASEMTVTQIAQFLETSGEPDHTAWPYGYDEGISFDENRLITAFGLANQKVRDQVVDNPACADMGSTVVAVYFRESMAVVASVGDSRVYLVRSNQLTQITTDDTIVERLLSEGAITQEEVRTHPMRNVVTAAIGAAESLEVQTLEFSLEPRDRLFLCSDGVHGVITDDEILRIVGGDGPLEQAVNDVTQLVLQRGGPDNLSCILIEYHSERIN